MTPPAGTVTFLFTDIEGSTNLLQRLGDAHYAEVLEAHRRIFRAAVQERGGHEVDTQGDSFLVAFQSARDAVMTAAGAQLAIATHPWPDGVSVRVRMGLHTGRPITVNGGYVGLDVHRAARICATGHGGQILLSEATSHLIEHDLPADVQLRDLGSHRLKDLKQPENIFQLLHVRLPADFPPLRSLNVLPHNLPIQLTSLIGREQELAEVRRLLTTTRLVTLTGTGGCGKTRLALQVAANVVEEFAHGVWLVELAALSDPALVPQTVASTLRVREQPGESFVDVLADYLRAKALLLVLDNCEHVVDSCAQLSETLLQLCPGLRILATSREGLNVPGERRFRVPSLSLPDVLPRLSVDRLALSEAARLFVDRAAQLAPTFAITDQNASTIAHIVRRLDGIPLAIEMAAARTSVLSVDAIASRLDDQFQLLSGGHRTALPRHQTLQATMEWSYGLLSEQERTLLRRLSVFAGGWTLEAAEAVCAGDGVQEYAVLDLLARLADKSLIVVEERDEEMRHRQLETIRQYSRERLQEGGETTTIHQRHRDWVLALVEQAEPKLLGPEQTAWFNRLDLEHDNLRTALEWSLERNESEAALRMASAVSRYWTARGYSAEGRGWLEAGLKRHGELPANIRAKALKVAGTLAVQGQGDYAAGSAFYQESLALWRQLDDKNGIADLNLHLGLVATLQGDHATARGLYEETLAIMREKGARHSTAVLAMNLGLTLTYQGEYAKARPLMDESLGMFRGLGDKRYIAAALTNLGFLAIHQKDYASASALYVDGLTIRRELGDKWGITFSLEGLAVIAAAQGEATRAARLLGAAEALREAIRAPLAPVYRTDHESNVNLVRSSLSQEAFTAAWNEGRMMPLEDAVGEALRPL